MAGTPSKVLIVVHPGSLCGSAEFNIGRQKAKRARDGLCALLAEWNGSLVVIDGALSDELTRYRTLDEALKTSLRRARERGCAGLRRTGDDPDQVEVATEVAAQQQWKRRGASCEVAGAWLHADGTGCVGSVVSALLAIGVEARVSGAAVSLDQNS